MRSRTWTDEQFIEAVTNSKSIANVLRCIGLGDKSTGSNYYMIKKEVKRLGISTDHWTGQGHNKGTKKERINKYSTDDILVENSPRYIKSTESLKKRLLGEGILQLKCSLCGLGTSWNEKPLSLALDHINGINNDHRIENLRILCPNCHSQTDTFAGRNKKVINPKKVFTCILCNKVLRERRKSGSCRSCLSKITPIYPEDNKCQYCKKPITSKFTMCLSCAQRARYGRLDRPTKEQLLEDIKELGYCGTGRKYKVSDNAIRKWMK